MSVGQAPISRVYGKGRALSKCAGEHKTSNKTEQDANNNKKDIVSRHTFSLLSNPAWFQIGLFENQDPEIISP